MKWIYIPIILYIEYGETFIFSTSCIEYFKMGTKKIHFPSVHILISDLVFSFYKPVTVYISHALLKKTRKTLPLFHGVRQVPVKLLTSLVSFKQTEEVALKATDINNMTAALHPPFSDINVSY